MGKILAVILICVFGFSSRLFVFQSQHPDTDELFELRHLQSTKWADTLKRTTFYGDHTSYPGEYLIHWIPMRILNMFEKPTDLSYENGTISLTKKQCWILAVPKITVSLLSFYLFWLLCGSLLKTTLGYFTAFIVFTFNSTLIYHSFSLRPYGILPELAIINLFLATRENQGLKFAMFHGAVIFFTCISHAYGILIAFLPMIYFWWKRHQNIVFWIVPALILWAYYASYNTFGMTPNKAQSVVNTFQFITKENFLNGILDTVFSGSVLTIAALALVIKGAVSAPRRDWMFLLALVIIPLTLIILVDIKTSYWIHPRQYCWIIPALALWCGRMADKCS